MLEVLGGAPVPSVLSSTPLTNTAWHDPMDDFSKVPEVEAADTPEEGPLFLVGRVGGVWMSRCSGDATVPQHLASVLSLLLRSRHVVPHGGQGKGDGRSSG